MKLAWRVNKNGQFGYIRMSFLRPLIMLLAVIVPLLFIYRSPFRGIETAENALLENDTAAGDSAGEKSTTAAEPQFSVDNRQLILKDVNSDETMDVILNIKMNSDRTTRLAAINGKDGSLLWAGDETDDKLTLIDDKLLASEETGVLTAYSTTDGTAVWRTVLNELVDSYCVTADQKTIVTLKDDRVLDLDMSNGNISPMEKMEKDTQCLHLQGVHMLPTACPKRHKKLKLCPFFNRVSETGGPYFYGGESNMGLFITDTKVDSTVMLGMKGPGTQVPKVTGGIQGNWMIPGEEVSSTWVTPVTTLNPLMSRISTPFLRAAASGGKLFVPYSYKENDESSRRLSCIDINTGKIIWDVSLPRYSRWARHNCFDSGNHRINASLQYVYIVHFNLYAFRIQDGSLAWQL